MSNEIINKICKDVNLNSVQFAIIIDGTQDIQRNEQEAICVRHITNSFEIHEDLLGLYEVSSTTGEVLCAMLKDCLIRLQLPIENLRAQTDDGASNVSGIYKWCQSRVKEFQPLANYYHMRCSYKSFSYFKGNIVSGIHEGCGGPSTRVGNFVWWFWKI